MDTLQLQFSYSHWASGQWIDFVYSEIGHDVYLYKIVNHIIKAERGWLERIAGQTWNRDLWEVESKTRLLELQEANRLMAAEVFSRPLNDRIQIVRLSGETYEPQLAAILQHVFLHGENHRGQLASFSAKAGLKYPALDYMAFVILHQL